MIFTSFTRKELQKAAKTKGVGDWFANLAFSNPQAAFNWKFLPANMPFLLNYACTDVHLGNFINLFEPEMVYTFQVDPEYHKIVHLRKVLHLLPWKFKKLADVYKKVFNADVYIIFGKVKWEHMYFLGGFKG